MSIKKENSTNEPSHISRLLRSPAAIKVIAGVIAITTVGAVSTNYQKNEGSVVDVKAPPSKTITYSEGETIIPPATTTSSMRKALETGVVVTINMQFEKTDKILYAKEDISLLEYPTETSESLKTVDKGTALHVVGQNDEYLKVEYEGEILYTTEDVTVPSTDYIFTEVSKTAITTTIAAVYNDIESAIKKTTAANFINNGLEVNIIAENENYAKTEDNQYISTDCITEDENYIFEDVSFKVFSKGDAPIMSNLSKDAVILRTMSAGEEIEVIGQNDTEYFKVLTNGAIGYVNIGSVSEEHFDLYPFKTLSKNSCIEYGTTPDGIVSILPESEKTEENVMFLAQLIQCEAGGEGYDGKRAVGTVVVNRVFAGCWGGNTIRTVIEAPKQFTPVSTGAIYSTVPSQECIDAARDVIMNGFRSFPAFVLSFQSIRDGYWSGQTTYVTTYTDNGTWPQYFSYRQQDLAKYGL